MSLRGDRGWRDELISAESIDRLTDLGLVKRSQNALTSDKSYVVLTSIPIEKPAKNRPASIIPRLCAPACKEPPKRKTMPELTTDISCIREITHWLCDD